MIQQELSFLQGISPTFLVIGIFFLSIGIFVTGIKLMFWSFDELDILIERWKNRGEKMNKKIDSLLIKSFIFFFVIAFLIAFTLVNSY